MNASESVNKMNASESMKKILKCFDQNKAMLDSAFLPSVYSGEQDATNFGVSVVGIV